MFPTDNLRELLNDEGRTLDTLSGSEVATLMGGLRGSRGRHQLNELKTISDYFSQTSGAGHAGLVDEGTLQVRLERLRNAATLLSFASVLPDALQALVSLHLCSPTDVDFVALGALVARLGQLAEIRLGDTPTLLASLRAHLHGLDVCQLNLILAMAQAHQVGTVV